MISPSFTYKNDEETLTWTTQYTYDKLGRVPDRGPSYSILPSGTSIKTGFAQNGDYVDDVLQVIRSDLSYEFAPNWIFHWAASYRQAEQNFDHFYLGGYCATATTVIRNAGTCQGHVGDISQIYYWQQTDNKTTSNTFDIKGEFNTGSIKHNLVFGSDWSYEQREPRLANTNQNGSAIYGYVDPITGERQSSRGTGPLKISQHNYNQGTSLGFFAQDLISLNEQVKIMLGMRYDSYDFSTTNKLPNVAADKRKRSINDDSFSPNVGVVWQPNEHQSLYASYSKSFAPFGGSMGVNPISSASQDMNIFNAEPQYNEQYEMGVKSDWFDERLNTQFSIYDIRKKNIRYRPDPDVPDVWAVGGEHQSKGLEFSFIGRVLDNLFVRGGYGYTDAQVKKDKEKPENVGNTLSNTSKNTGNLFVRYLPTEKLYGEVGVTYVGSYYPNINNLTKMDGFNRVDAAIGYSADPWNLTLAVSNLTNKEYWRSDSMPGTPRSFLMRLNYQF